MTQDALGRFIESIMKEAFSTLREFFVGASYSVFAAGCVLAVLTETVSYLTVVAAFIFALLLLILAWISAQAEASKMIFQISDAVALERIFFVSMIIVMFGFVSIGGLWLWRRLGTSPGPRTEIDQNLAEMAQRLETLRLAIHERSAPHSAPQSQISRDIVRPNVG